MGKKAALLIGIGNYGEGLPTLQCSANGVTELATILSQPEIGGFDEVIPLIDPDVGTMRSQIGAVFGRLAKSDLALFYFTGHGIKDMTGEFYLTTAQTQLFDNGRLNPGTAVEAEFVKRMIGTCYAQRKVIILDCCFGAAFAEGFLTMDDGGMDVQADLGGEGWVVLTAATARNYALEQEGEPLSVYTRYLVEGLKTGAAAREGQEFVAVGHLHDYVRGKVETAAPTMEPAIFNGYQGEDIWLARAVINPETSFRQKVQSKVRRGRIAPAGRPFLETWRNTLGLTPEQSQAIVEEVLRPYVEKQRHLDQYAEILLEEIADEFPLSPEAIKDLNDLQRLWNLRDEDVEPLIVQAKSQIQSHKEDQQELIDSLLTSENASNYQASTVDSLVNSDNRSSFSFTTSILWEESQSLWKEVVRQIPENGLKILLIKQTNLIKLESNIARIGYQDDKCLPILIPFKDKIQKSFSSFLKRSIFVNFEPSTNLTLNDYLLNLDSLWSDVATLIEPVGTRALFMQQGFLIDYDGVSAKVGISSCRLLRMAASRTNNLEKAFEKVLGRHIDVTSDEAQPLDLGKFEQEIWQTTLDVLPTMGTKALLTQQCNLINFDGLSVKIGITSQKLLNLLSTRVDNLKISFGKVIGYPIDVTIETFENSP